MRAGVPRVDSATHYRIKTAVRRIYIYKYKCMCVCVCVRARGWVGGVGVKMRNKVSAGGSQTRDTGAFARPCPAMKPVSICMQSSHMHMCASIHPLIYIFVLCVFMY